MLEKYFIDIQDTGYLFANRANATTKPRKDVERITSSFGFKQAIVFSKNMQIDSKNIYARILNKLIGIPNRIYILTQFLKLFFLSHKTILVQYPFLHSDFMHYLSILKKRNKIIVLFHDIESIRYNTVSTSVSRIFSLAGVCIYHTQEMCDAIEKLGIHKEYRLLQFFDYTNTFNKAAQVEQDNIEVLYAGNLIKSKFLRELPSLKTAGDTKFLLYGKKDSNIVESSNIIYKGFFDSEDISNVEGNWGLIWDGDSIDTCSGPLGEYLKINAPFKFSMTLALGIPVIVWSKSAMARYVKEYHLGICVDNLNQIEQTIHNLTDEEVSQITKGVNEYSRKVKQGDMLKQVLQSL